MKIKKISKRTKDIPQKKLKRLNEIQELVRKNKTILLVSIKNIPASQFQEISKNLRKEAVVKVPKKRMTLKALDLIEDKAKEELKKLVGEDMAILFSNVDIPCKFF